MELTVLNQSKEAKWMRYRQDFMAIAIKTFALLNIEKESSFSVIFVDDQQIQEINREYRDKDVPTDVISFAMQDSEDEVDFVALQGATELGDIFINVEAIKRQSQEYAHTQRREVCFLFTHGLLHLLGYDHGNSVEEIAMFSLQEEILNGIAEKRYRCYEKI